MVKSPEEKKETIAGFGGKDLEFNVGISSENGLAAWHVIGDCRYCSMAVVTASEMTEINYRRRRRDDGRWTRRITLEEE